MNFILRNLQDTQNLAEKMAMMLPRDAILCLYGGMGTGKTTFTSYLIKEIYRQNHLPECDIISPTFSIIQEYILSDRKIAHFDLFRLEGESSLEEIGLEEYLDDPTILTIIEWPEIAELFLPKDKIECFFSFIEDQRELTLNLHGKYSTQNKEFINHLII